MAALPFNTCRAPLKLSRITLQDVLFRPHVLLRGLAAHSMAEALLSAPQVLGSMQILFNPTGLVTSVQKGISDLLRLPLLALQERSASRFFAGVGQGSASLVMEVSGGFRMDVERMNYSQQALINSYFLTHIFLHHYLQAGPSTRSQGSHKR
jgi:hypothetical protein